jgi:hypothetical protein
MERVYKNNKRINFCNRLCNPYHRLLRRTLVRLVLYSAFAMLTTTAIGTLVNGVQY